MKKKILLTKLQIFKMYESKTISQSIKCSIGKKGLLEKHMFRALVLLQTNWLWLLKDFGWGKRITRSVHDPRVSPVIDGRFLMGLSFLPYTKTEHPVFGAQIYFGHFLAGRSHNANNNDLPNSVDLSKTSLYTFFVFFLYNFFAKGYRGTAFPGEVSFINIRTKSYFAQITSWWFMAVNFSMEISVFRALYYFQRKVFCINK